MKQTFTLIALAGFAVGAFAQEEARYIVQDICAQKISSDGSYAAGQDNSPLGGIAIMNVATGEVKTYNEFTSMSLGRGNSVANDGTAVGFYTERYYGFPVIFTASGASLIEALSPAESYIECYVNCITPDGSRIAGYYPNGLRGNTPPGGGDGPTPPAPPTPPSGGGNSPSTPGEDGPNLPTPASATLDDMNISAFYCEVVNGVVGEPIALPVPETDVWGETPFYATAEWINTDGNVIIGQVRDSHSSYYPIVYTQAADGSWSYSLPALPLFNPNNLDMPVYPERPNVRAPREQDFMTQEELDAYNAAFDEYRENGGMPGGEGQPKIQDFMTEDELAEYNEANDEYERIMDEYMAANTAANDQFQKIQRASKWFSPNYNVLDATGEILICTQEERGDFNPDLNGFEYIYDLWKFDLKEDTYEHLFSDYTNIVPSQYLSQFDLLTGVTYNAPYETYVWGESDSDFVPFVDFIEAQAENYSWMKENLTFGDEIVAGCVGISEDGSICVGGISFSGEAGNEIFSYVLNNNIKDEPDTPNEPDGPSTSVYSVNDVNVLVKFMKEGKVYVEGNISLFEVYDVAGRKVYTGNNVSGTVDTRLGNGLYVVRTTDAQGNQASKKVRF